MTSNEACIHYHDDVTLLGIGGRVSSTTISKINESVKTTNSSLEPITAPPKVRYSHYLVCFLQSN